MDDAIPVYAPELPLRSDAIVPEAAVRDRQCPARRFAGNRGGANEIADLDELTFMLQSGSDRSGAFAIDAACDRFGLTGSDRHVSDVARASAALGSVITIPAPVCAAWPTQRSAGRQ